MTRQIVPALIVVLIICTSSPAEQKPFDKLIDAADILNQFAEGQQTVKIIVNLEQPAMALSATRKQWNSRSFLKQLQSDVRVRQQDVINSLPKGLFKLRRCFENQAAFSCEVTFKGLNKFLSHHKVKSVEPIRQKKLFLAQGIPLMNGMVYRTTYYGQGTAIAICDSGIDYTHPKLGGGGFPNSKVIGGYDTGDDDSDPYPDSASIDNAHGTCCAGIAAGDTGTVGDYIGGVAYGAKLYALKIEDSGGWILDDHILDAWNWCISHKNDDPSNPILVISNSFGGGQYYSSCDGPESAFVTAMNNAVNAGITLVAASGNEGYCDSMASPACLSKVISIGAVYDRSDPGYNWGFCVEPAACAGVPDPLCAPNPICWNTPAPDMVTCYSNTASFLDLLAPAHDAYTTDIVGPGGYSSGDYYTEFGGTSASAPYAAGAVACLQSAAKAITGDFLSPTQVKDKLVSTGDDITDGKIPITKPRINLADAIDNLQGSPPTAQDVDVTITVNTFADITLQASDDGQPDPPGALSYIITTLPTNGSLADPQAGAITAVPYTLANNGNIVTYTPDTGFVGTDLFNYKANDRGSSPYGGDSNVASVNISVLIFFDDFPSMTINSSNWPATSGSPAVDSSADSEPSPPYSLHLEKNDSVTSKEIDLSFCLTAQLQYYWQRYSTERGDDLYVDYWDGLGWQRLRTHLYNQGSTTEFTEEIVLLPPEAQHSGFKLRFEASCSSNADEWYIDDVNIACQFCDMQPPALYSEPNITKGPSNTISWEPVADACEYFATCANDTNFFNTIANSGWTGETEYKFTGLELGRMYWYRAKARSQPDIDIWQQTAQADFETDVLVDTNTTADGNVVLAEAFGSYVSDGNITTVKIDLPEYRQWDTVLFSKTTPQQTELTIDVLDGDDPCTLLLEDIAWGTDISTVETNSIKLRANLSTSNSSVTPVLGDWSVSYVDTSTFCQSSWSAKQWSVQCGIEGDFQPDCIVDSNDLAHFVWRWLHIDCNDIAGDESDWCYGADITKNSKVDFYDYVKLADNWGKCIGPFCE